jgi:sugar porter (SP) family MFS transporter
MSSTYGYLVAFSAAMGGLLFGYEIGVVSQTLAMDSFNLFMGMRYDEIDPKDGLLKKTDQYPFIEGMVTFMFLLGCSVGAMFASWFCDYMGRKRSILVAGTVFLVGGAVQSFTNNATNFFIGRLVAGLGIGVLSMCCPLYISETSPTSIRGRMITIQQLMITIGILIASIVNTIIIKNLGGKYNAIEWRLALGMQCVPAVVLVFLVVFMPMSPRWLASKSRDTECLSALAKLRASNQNDSAVQHEYHEIIDSVVAEKQVGEGSWSEVFAPGILNRTVRCILLQFFQQWTGINVILYYQSNLLQGMGLDKDAATVPFTIANNFVNVIATFPGMYFIERIGRRRLLILGGFGMGLAHYAVCLFVKLGDGGARIFYYGAIVSVYVFIFSFASTWGPIAWVYQSEVFPLRVRSKGTSLATLSNWSNNAIIALATPYIVQALGPFMYLIFGSAGIIMAIFTFFAIPETMGKSLEDMDEIFGAPEKKEQVEYGKK